MLSHFEKLAAVFASIMLSMAVFSSVQAEKVKSQDPKFRNYPVAVMKGRKAPLRLNADDMIFKTRYRELYKSAPNFAGHYALTGVGCGGGCVFILAVDFKTGKTVGFDVSAGEELSACSEEYGDNTGEYIEKGFGYEPDSRLFAVTGRMPGLECGTRFYQEKNGKMLQILDVPIKKKL